MKNTNYQHSSTPEARIPTQPYSQYLTHAHNNITPAVAAMDSCFALMGAHQHGIAVGSMNGRTLVSRTLYRRGECKSNSFERQLYPWIIERLDKKLMSRGLISYRRLVGSCSKMALDGSIIVEICDETMAKMWRKPVEM